jgi:hypothetical protein
VLADGARVVIFGGEDGDGPLADLHVLDVPRRLWWQVHAAGAYPRPRSGHVAALVGGDVLFFGGTLDVSDSIHVLNVEAMELRTSAPLGAALAADTALSASCVLHAGSLGATAQVWRCGPRLRQRPPAVPEDVGRDSAADVEALRLRYFTGAGLPVPAGRAGRGG